MSFIGLSHTVEWPAVPSYLHIPREEDVILKGIGKTAWVPVECLQEVGRSAASACLYFLPFVYWFRHNLQHKANTACLAVSPVKGEINPQELQQHQKRAARKVCTLLSTPGCGSSRNTSRDHIPLVWETNDLRQVTSQTDSHVK